MAVLSHYYTLIHPHKKITKMVCINTAMGLHCSYKLSSCVIKNLQMQILILIFSQIDS